MTPGPLEELEHELARELRRSASAQPIDVVDAHARLDHRIARDRRRTAVAGIAALIVLSGAAAVPQVLERRQTVEVIDNQPQAPVTVAVVARGLAPRSSEDFGWSLLQAVRVAPGTTFVQWEPAGTYADARRALDEAAAAAAAVLLTGPDLNAHVAEVAARHPQTEFVIVDGVAAVPGAHVVSIGAEQAAFLAGALAASVSQTGQLGVVFGAQLETTEALAAGFSAGASTVNPDVSVDVRYVTVHPDISGFEDGEAQERLADALFGAGADVVFGDAAIPVAARLSADGDQRWAIGVDGDRRATAAGAEAEVVLTSVLKDHAGAASDALELLASGRLDADLVLGLSSGRTGLGTRAPAAVPYDAIVADLDAGIRRGEIVVPVSRP